MFGGHVAHSSRDGGVPLVEHLTAKEQGHAGHHEPPDKQRAQRDDEGIAETDDITQTQHGSTSIVFKHQFGLFSQVVAIGYHARGDILVPPAKGGHDEIVEAAHETGNEQGARLGGLMAEG